MEFLDLLSFAMPVCQDLEHAIKKTCEKLKSPVSNEFYLAVEQISAGKKTKDALNDAAKRLEVNGMSSLISQINQSMYFGTDLDRTIQMQAKRMREMMKDVFETRYK